MPNITERATMIGNTYIVRGGQHENRRYLVFAQDSREAWVRTGEITNPTVTLIKQGIDLSEHNDLHTEASKLGWTDGSGWSGDNHDDWFTSL